MDLLEEGARLALEIGHSGGRVCRAAHSENGFTMVETVFVIGIVGIVGAVVSLLLFQLLTSHTKTMGWVDSYSNTARVMRSVLYGSLNDDILGIAAASSIQDLTSTPSECLLEYSVNEETLILHWTEATRCLTYNGRVILRDVTRCDLELDTEARKPVLYVSIQVGASSPSKRAISMDTAVKLRNL